MIQLTSERLIAYSTLTGDYVIGSKEKEHILIVYALSDADIRTTYPETARSLAEIMKIKRIS